MTFPEAQKPHQRRFRTFRPVAALMLREMSSTYGRSPGGYLWTIVEPVAGIALLSLVFGLISRSPALGNNFPYYFAAGLLPFTFYASLSNQIAGALLFSRPLLAYPAVTFLDALLARSLLNAMTQILVMVLVFWTIITYYDLRPILIWPEIFLGMAMLLSVTLSVGIVNCYLTTSYPLWGRLWGILNRPMFILSGVFFLPENIPALYRDILLINPMLHVTSQFRKGFFITYDGVHVAPLYVFTVSMVLAIFGLLLLLRNYKDIMQK